jgi:hypothetical protein
MNDHPEQLPTGTVWIGTEGAPMANPILCCEARTAMRFAAALERARIADTVAVLPCCHNSDDIGCVRDNFDDYDEPDPERQRIVAVLRDAAARAGIEWPTDIGQPEEYPT